MGCFSKTIKFDVNSLIGQTIYAIEIIPRRQQERKNKMFWVTCGKAKVRKVVEKNTCNPCPDASIIPCGNDVTPENSCESSCIGTLCSSDKTCNEISGLCE